MALVLFKIPAFHNAFLNPTKDVTSLDDMVVFCAIAWSVFLLAHVHGLGYVRAFFTNATLRFLGLISYSAYLWHRIVLGETDDSTFFPGYISLWIFIGLVCVVAAISYWLIERPLTRIRLTSRKPQPETRLPSET